MAHEIIQIVDNFISIRFMGMLKQEDMKVVQDKALELIEEGKKVRLLAILDNFQGWDKTEDWGDVEFLMEHGNNIIKMAFVGDENCKDDIYLFVGKGLRTTEIEFFPHASLEQAKTWVQA